MNILAIDTAGDCCALSLRSNGANIVTHVIATQRDQAKILAPVTQNILATNNLTTQAIDRFGIAIGPGSFTGLRVGLAFIHGLVLANNKPAYGIDNFCITAHAIRMHYPTDKAVLIVRESKRADLFYAWREPDNSLSPYLLGTAAQLAQAFTERNDALITGDGAKHVIQLDGALQSTMLDISDKALIQSLAELCENAESTPYVLPQPLYMRGADVTAPQQINNLA